MAMQLVIRLDNARPIRARDELLSALVSDFRGAFGRELVIARLEHGSLVAVFEDPELDAAAAKQLWEFGDQISTIAGIALSGHYLDQNIFGTGGRAGSCTVEELAKLAAGSDGTVEVRVKGADVSQSFLRLTPSGADRIRSFVARNRASLGNR